MSNILNFEYQTEEQSNLKFRKIFQKPDIAVRYNRRTKLRKLHNLNDKDLPFIVRNTYGKEHSQEIKGFIETMERKLNKTQIDMFLGLNRNLQHYTRIQDENYMKLVKLQLKAREFERRKLEDHVSFLHRICKLFY